MGGEYHFSVFSLGISGNKSDTLMISVQQSCGLNECINHGEYMEKDHPYMESLMSESLKLGCCCCYLKSSQKKKYLEQNQNRKLGKIHKTIKTHLPKNLTRQFLLSKQQLTATFSMCAFI